MTSERSAFRGLVALACWQLATSAGAAPLPAATTATRCTVGATDIRDPLSCAVGNMASATLTLAPFASSTAMATNGSASAQQNWYFQVIGGNPGDLVPLLISTVLETSGTGAGFLAQAQLSVVYGSSSTQVLRCTGPPANCNQASSFAGDVAITVQSGAVNRLFLNATISKISIAEGTGFASADPLIRVDPSFASAANYSIVLSDGVANAIPEPGTLPLVGGALGGLAWRSRRIARF